MNILEDMKVVFDGKICCRIVRINFKSGLKHSYDIEVPEEVGTCYYYDVGCDGIKPLLKFPITNKDDEKCWSGDLVQHKNSGIKCLIFNGLRWHWFYID